MDDKELLDGFLAGTLATFPHRDHARTAYLLLGSHGVDEATHVLSDRIRAIAVAVGAPGKFHVTDNRARVSAGMLGRVTG